MFRIATNLDFTTTFKFAHSLNKYLILGDLFEKLEDEDEQGWCKGRKDGKVGLYPANYIEVI